MIQMLKSSLLHCKLSVTITNICICNMYKSGRIKYPQFYSVTVAKKKKSSLILFLHF